MATITIRGAEHAYELTPPPESQPAWGDVALTSTSSDRPVLVFIHGWLLSRRYWQPLVECLSPYYRCLTYDLRGFGESDVGDCEAYGPASYAEDLVELLTQLNLHNAWLIGHSLGGSIALWAAELASERVAGVICMNSGGGIYLKEEFDRFRFVGQMLLRFRPRWLPWVPFIDRQFARDSVARPLERSWGRCRVTDFVVAHPAAALGTLLDSTTETEVHLLPQIVARLKQPVYFLAGQNDPIMDPQYVRHLASFHASFNDSGDNVIEIPDCGHLVMVEQTALVAEQIRELVA
ncbi:alpha/beta fold hydrolase [Leptolyngbya sp. FACHB-261]|uniref:alpha/beta fold hydrolase n=1 Tax=Leptolyngbya sp. FACHB-261 TaxID=2692806 RepID=UPI00168591E0|nr:alpha/beta hydrolase [Leptolyngbya sp. FACHB-261]MBD2102236.1 alpha/beta hydrolase [Leptolyngbya sp. FACHB-261]